MEVPNWIKKRYLVLWAHFRRENFTFDEVVKFLKGKFGDSEEQVKLILSYLKRGGYLMVKRSEKDLREKIYKLNELFPKTNHILTRQELDNVLKKAADIIRTSVDYTFILLLLFYKTMSDKFKREYEKKYKELLKKGLGESEVREEVERREWYDFYIPQNFLWENLGKDPLKLSENFSKALKNLAQLNPDYKDIFDHFDFIEFIRNPENSEILRQLYEIFSAYSFDSVSPDVLGDAYEWILKYFAPTKAKEGEVYTPREVIRLMVEILKPQPEKTLYDPAMGSGGMLIIAYQYVAEKYGKEKADTLTLYGQELNPKTLALAKMNILIHDIKNINVLQGNTLRSPKFKTGSYIKQFDYVIANPPWNQKGYGEKELKKGEFWRERFEFGFPTKQSADWAWIQHMLASAKDDGKVAVVIDTGAVSRGGREKEIRKKILEEKDWFECIILLPEKLFYNTGAPGLIIIFNKNKPEQRKDKILLINASKEFVPGKPQNSLGNENIKKIVRIYDEFKEVEGISKIITKERARESDYNLSPSRFVSIIEEENYREIGEIVKEIKEVEKERVEIEKKIEKILSKLNVGATFRLRGKTKEIKDG